MARAFGLSILAAALPLVIPATAHDAVCHQVHRHQAVHAMMPNHPVSGVAVVIDQARLVAFPKPVKTVFVGNPTVVDVSMIDSQHAFLLGKTFGMTNLIALAPDGNQISNQQVVVLNNGAAVTVNRGAEQFNYMCTSAHCEAAPRPGDPTTFVSNTESATTQHENVATANGNSVVAQQAQN